jgi:hypothetical protein
MKNLAPKRMHYFCSVKHFLFTFKKFSYEQEKQKQKQNNRRKRPPDCREGVVRLVPVQESDKGCYPETLYEAQQGREALWLLQKLGDERAAATGGSLIRRSQRHEDKGSIILK